VHEGDNVAIDENNKATATVKYLCAWSQVLRLMPRRNVGVHPEFNSMKVSNVAASKKSPGVAELTVTYKGVVSGDNDGPDGTGAFEPVEECSVSTRQEPIETHPDWSTIGGTEAAPLNDAIYDDSGLFTGFKEGSSKFGVTDYLAVGATYRRSYASKTKPSLAGVGQIDTPTGAPTVTSGYTWLKSGVSFSQDGDLYSVSEEWLLSGPSGWDTDIY
jgi:hypothetical protein